MLKLAQELFSAVSIFIFIYYPLSTLCCMYLLHIKKVLGNHFVVFIILYRKKTLFLASPQESARPQQTYICEPQENRMEEVQRRLLISI